MWKTGLDITSGSSGDNLPGLRRSIKWERHEFADKVVVVTGASSGIGESTARLLAKRGARVVWGSAETDRINAICERDFV